MFDCVPKSTLLPVKKSYLNYQLILSDFTKLYIINYPVLQTLN